MQSVLNTDWQERMGRVRKFYEEANAEIRQQKAKNFADMAAEVAVWS